MGAARASVAPYQFRHPELLAPAGGPDALRAAVANGADAVYLGVEVLNARRGAENFTLDDARRDVPLRAPPGRARLPDRERGRAPGRAGEALELVDAAWAAGVDAVIVQDLGLLRAIRTALPHVRVHASTQINAHNTADRPGPRFARRLARDARARGLRRRDRVARLGGPVEVESFVHGALCVCYSGQCLMSSLIGGRSANRGLCAQPCRLPYELVDGAGIRPRPHRARTCCRPRTSPGIAVLPQLVAAGVAALKIEGRMKSAEYVALVTGVYRAALDRALAEPGGLRGARRRAGGARRVVLPRLHRGLPASASAATR